MPQHCVVRGCKSNLKDGFPFPLDRRDYVSKWVLALEKHQELPANYQQKLVCPAHFRETDFLKSKKNQINKKAVPSVFPDIPDDYVSEEEVSTVPKVEIKHEPEEDITRGGKTLRGKRLTIPITEPDSEEDVGSDYEPTDSNEEMSFSEEESENEKLENDSQDNTEMDFQNDTCDTETAKSVDPNIAFPEICNDEVIDSDYEPVTEVSLEALQEKLSKKTEVLNKETSTLGSMEEMIKNQAATIRKLEEELAELIKTEAEENKGESNPDKINVNVTRIETGNKTAFYSNVDLQIFTISLYYFSPKVYSYLESIMPYLPPKSVVLDWVKSGHAFTLFPPGVLLKENFVLE